MSKKAIPDIEKYMEQNDARVKTGFRAACRAVDSARHVEPHLCDEDYLYCTKPNCEGCDKKTQPKGTDLSRLKALLADLRDPNIEAAIRAIPDDGESIEITEQDVEAVAACVRRLKEIGRERRKITSRPA